MSLLCYYVMDMKHNEPFGLIETNKPHFYVLKPKTCGILSRFYKIIPFIEVFSEYLQK